MQIGLGIGIPFTKSQVWLAVQAVFTPADLFDSGANGLWLDPSDYSTLFQNAAGTIPVTAVEQPVGLWLDKSKGLVFGSELVTNGGFDTDTDWVKGTGWTIDGGVATFTNPGFASPITQNILTANKHYRLTFTVSGASINVRPYFGTYTGSQFYTAAGTYTVNFQAGSDVVFGFQGVSGAAFSIDNISVRELPGNHAFNPSGNSANFPVLSARVNLLTKTEDFSDAVWGKTGINAFGSGSVANTTATTDPLGGSTADFIQENSATSGHDFSYGGAANLVSGSAVVISVYVKQAGRTRVTLGAYGAGPVAFRGFDLQSISSFAMGGSLVDPTAYSIYDAGNGWRKISVTYTATSSAAIAIQLLMISTGSTYNYTGDGTSGIYIWGADLRISNDALNQPAYQRVNTSTDYDTVGFKPYLRFNGVSQWLQTNSIAFTATDKMFVCAGLRKLSDASLRIFAELSADYNTNNGSFYVTAPHSTTSSGNYGSSSRGDAGSTTGHTARSSTLLSPITSVLSATHDIIGDLSALRINGSPNGTNGIANKGTGNFGNYPIYIGARAGTSQFFNGYLYQLVAVGKQASDAEITATETFINQKTGAY